ncbi:neprosin family prolyl endopeptidase [Streptomyces sp. RB6PN25]|uniref:Neprosin family prolyl endopeptidase n=1 Tax=Streptomyces humicola TaxID=2953240 RepID=A0ABT1PQ59_9ACTN|nr:neprosin family prolyl endopeptidase [Streptomyces humicola]MCQ4079060.1 neprosin family prolyl endopeptidase [Streptomyces humicola]
MRAPLIAGLGAVATVAALLTGPPAQAAVSGVTPTVPPVARAAASGSEHPICWFDACYDYVYGRQQTDTAGASVDMLVGDPVVDPTQNGEHSLQELALQDSAQQSTVEVGWTVDEPLNGDYLPHLFVYHWVNGQTTCYNGCGFVQVSHTITPGMPLESYVPAEFGLRNIDGDWWVLFDNLKIGYFPGSLWGDSYTRAQLVTAFGENALNPTDLPSCTQMGNGRYGSRPRSSWIAGYRLFGTTNAPSLTVTTTSPAYYDAGQVTATSFRLGGPGKGAC